MLIPITNEPRAYAWGSTSLIAELEGREPTGEVEAEVWFGDHAGSPARVPDGRPLGEWLAAEGAATGAPPRLPYLLKLLAAASPLSIQAHPSKREAEIGFAREEAAGIPRDAPERLYRDDNHKPELIVAVSDTFEALAGLRDLADTRRLLAGLGEGAAALAAQLEGPDAGTALRDTVAWVFSPEAAPAVASVVEAVASHDVAGFEAEIAVVRRIAAEAPGDPGVVVALLMNVVTLRRGEALYLPAGVLHAYLAGLGVELMAASDNVLRGGLTPKHVDVDELVRVLDPAPGLEPRLAAVEIGQGLTRFDAGVPDFALVKAEVGGSPIAVALEGPAIVLATVGDVVISGAASGETVRLTPGKAVFVTPDEGSVMVSGAGEVFAAMPGR